MTTPLVQATTASAAAWAKFQAAKPEEKAAAKAALDAAHAAVIAATKAEQPAPAPLANSQPPLKLVVPPPPTWGDPVDFVTNTYAAPPFTGDEVPPALAEYPRLFAKAEGFDLSMPINSMLTVCAAAIPDYIRVCVEPGSSFTQPPILWNLTVNVTGGGKSPTFKTGLEPLWAIHWRELKEWRDREALRDKDDKSPPEPEPCTILTDVTIEKLADILIDNPRGVLLATDEFSTWLGSFDQYRNTGSGGGRDRGEWLRLFDGGHSQVGRVKRGTKSVKNWGASILTATTPTQLQDFSKHLPEDGLIQRFLIAFCQDMLAPDQRAPVNILEVEAARARYAQLVTALWSLTPGIGGGVVYLSPEAKKCFDAWRVELFSVRSAFREVEPAFAGHLAKYPGLTLRIALVFHCIRVALAAQAPNSPPGDPSAYAVPLDDMEHAIAFLSRSMEHARAMYLNREGGSNAYGLARVIARSILAHPPEKDELPRRDLLRLVSAFKKAPEYDQDGALRVVEAMGWIRAVEEGGGYNKGHPTRFAVNPGIGAKFQALAAEERKRREVISRYATGGLGRVVNVARNGGACEK